MITVVRFRSRKGTCVIPMEHVLGVRLQAEVKPFPGQRADVAGMIEWSGATIPVLSVLSSEGKHVLLLSAKGGPFGLLVDEVLGVVQLADSQVQPPPAGRARPIVEGVVKSNGGFELLVSADELSKELLGSPAAAPALLADELPLRLLLVEDNRVMQLAGKRMLSKLGYSVEVASSGAEAMLAMERATYDIVFMDVQMPEMDGLETMRKLALRWPDARPVVIGMSAGETEAERKECLDAGMSDFLMKPVPAATLMEALRKWGRKVMAATPGAGG